jgi:hypothetical protein
VREKERERERRLNLRVAKMSIVQRDGLLLFGILLLSYVQSQSQQTNTNEKNSPLYQNLPNCLKGDYICIEKKTKAKAIVCPMFKDEEGFLSEWVAYYQMHGFEHVYLYNDGSTDNSLVELKPWMDSGFVTVRSNFTAESLQIRPGYLKQVRFQA